MIKHEVVAYMYQTINGEELKLGYKFTKFTNTGKLSKSDDYYDLALKNPDLKQAAENEIKKYIDLQAQTKADMQRALELRDIINTSDFNGELVTIKQKISHSDWYDGNGTGHMRSRYNYKVPASVEKEALELSAIRKKHQGNDAFNFAATNYMRIVEREADHENDLLH